jgi:hypothetical protein
MSKLALLVRLEAKPGKEDELRSFLKSGLEIVQVTGQTFDSKGLNSR